jgi:glycosyltransferase involved in cell wall biosynthesis
LVSSHRSYRKNISPKILSIGHVIAVRNRVTLIKAVAKLKQVYPNISLEICGNDYLSPSTESLVNELGLFENVKFHGALPHETLPKMLSNSDLEIHDIHGSGFNLSTLESMASGVPTIVSSPLDYYPHAPLIDYQNTLLTRPDDVEDLAEKISLLLSNQELYAEISRGGIEYARKNFNLDNICKRHLQLFESIS